MPEVACPCCGSYVDPQRLNFDEEVILALDRMPLQRQTARLFVALSSANGRTVEAQNLIELMEQWSGREGVSESSLRSCIKRMNKSIRPFGFEAESVYGIGYKMAGTRKRDWRQLPIRDL